MPRKIRRPGYDIAVEYVLHTRHIRKQLGPRAVCRQLGLVEKRHLHPVRLAPLLELGGLEQRFVNASAVRAPQGTREERERVVCLARGDLGANEIIVMRPFRKAKRVDVALPDPERIGVGILLRRDECDAVRSDWRAIGVQKGQVDALAFREFDAIRKRKVDGDIQIRLKRIPSYVSTRLGLDSQRPIDD